MKIGALRPRVNGFTVVEVMVVVVIIGAMTALVVPRFSGRLGAAKLRQSAQHLLLAARYARQVSVTRRVECRLTINAKENAFAVMYEPKPISEPQVFAELRGHGVRKTELGGDIKFGSGLIDTHEDESVPEGVIRFDPMGSATAAVIQLTNGEQVWSVVIEPTTGRAALVRGQVSELANDREDLDA